MNLGLKSKRGRELYDLIGARATMTLIDRYGGLNCAIPACAHSSGLSAVIGSPAAHLLAARYGGELLHIPLEIQAYVRWLHFYQGRNIADIVRCVKRSRRNIRAMLEL